MRHLGKTGLAMLGLLAAMPGFALYKVVGPDGKVSYTDQPPPDNAKVQPLPAAAGAPAQAVLPFELRQVVQRFPVTYYTIANCAPCDNGRALLRQRGVPYNEKSISTAADQQAFERLGAQELPLLQIGKQLVSGFEAGEWNRYLDAAGYPRQSRLPRNFQFAAATPLSEPNPPASAATAPVSMTAPHPAPLAPPAAAAPPAPAGFRF